MNLTELLRPDWWGYALFLVIGLLSGAGFMRIFDQRDCNTCYIMNWEDETDRCPCICHSFSERLCDDLDIPYQPNGEICAAFQTAVSNIDPDNDKLVDALQKTVVNNFSFKFSFEAGNDKQ